MTRHEPTPVNNRKYPGVLSLTASIKCALQTVYGRTEKVLVSAGPMVWRPPLYGVHSRFQDWPVHRGFRVPYNDEHRFQHDWWRRMTGNRDLHPAVVAVLSDDWLPDPDRGGLENLVLEYPSLSSDMRLAYVQSEDKGRADRWTVTTAGKYIKSRWSYLDDHYIRDVVARTQMDAPQIWHEPRDIVRAVQYGPSSCMQWGSDDVGERSSDDFDPDEDDGTEFWVDNWKWHPYSVYDPKFGWRMAVRLEGKEIMARALVLHHSNGPHQSGEDLSGSVFVRSYRRSSGYSPADEALESWLQHMGVSKAPHWPLGTKFARVENPQSRFGGLMMPYLDGGIQSVTDEGSYMRLSNRGMACSSTDGTCGDDDSRICEDCDERANEEDGLHIGYDGDRWVGSCCSGSYTYVLGRRRTEYYVPDHDVVRVGDEKYDRGYLEDNSIVELDNGDYVHEDDAFCCPIDDRWYHVDDGQSTEDEGYVHESNAWQCYGSDEWYSTNTKWVRVDGETYHPDYVPDDEEEVEDGDTFDLPYQKPEGSIPNEAQLVLPIVVEERPPLIYAHRATHARGIRYRAGRNGRIDVLGCSAPLDMWQYGYGEANENLTNPAMEYYLCPNLELETT
jgi:hypothetical protein